MTYTTFEYTAQPGICSKLSCDVRERVSLNRILFAAVAVVKRVEACRKNFQASRSNIASKSTLSKNARHLCTSLTPLQVAKSPLTIDFGRAFKIPPVQKRSTASNITFDQGGEFKLHLTPGTDLFQVKEPCNDLKKLSSASHGVKSRPLTSDPICVKTMPLLSPTMEKDLLMENWNILESTPFINNKDSTTFTTWEENYQDLSGWCMDTIQAPYTFPVGESKTTKISGKEIEETGMLVKKKGDVNDLGSTPEKVLNSAAEKVPVINHQTVPLLDDKQELTGGAIDVPEMWLDLPQSSIALQTDEWIQLVDSNEVNEPLQRVSKVEKIEIEYTDQQDDWNVIKTLDNTNSDNFDLLSYLCDDNMQSPESISTDSIDPSQVSTSMESSEEKPLVTMRLRSNRKMTNKSETITSSTIKSPELIKTKENPPLSRTSTRSTRGVNLKIKKEIKSITRGKKREYESDSDDSDGSYRESRKKNNEASRKSRMNKKAKELEMMARATALEKDNRILKIKVEQLEKMVNTLRAAILQSALKKNV